MTALASWAAFLALLVLVVARWSPLMRFDREAILDLTEYTRGQASFRTATTAISEAMQSQWVVLYTVLVAAVLFVLKLLAEASWLMFTVGSGNLLNPLLKQVVDRERPVLAAPIDSFSGLSFPSGHAASAMLTCAALLALVWPCGHRAVRVVSVVSAAVIVILSGGSRLVLGAHYPSDIAGGYLLGVAWVAACHPLLTRRS